MTILSKEMLKDMRDANTIVFHHKNGASYMRCIFKTTFRGKEVETESKYDLDGCNYKSSRDRFEACASISYLQQSDSEEASIISTLHANDVIELEWYPDAWSQGYLFAANAKRGDATTKYEANMNDEEREAARKSEYGYGLREGFAGLHGDILKLRVQRGKKRLTFTLAHSITPDNSARMIKTLAERQLRLA